MEHTHGRLNVKLAIGLAAPHTWAASVLPAILGGVLSVAKGAQLDVVSYICCLVICVLMQSCVNVLNDYFDFVKGTDTVENSDDPSDAVLVYNNLRPDAVLRYGLLLLLAAALVGIVVVARCGILPLSIGLIGGLTILLYSAGTIPISYMPIGEFVSGAVMGCLIPLGISSAMLGKLDPWILYASSPMLLGVAMIMFTNNISDIERDTKAGRKTMPVLMGRHRALVLYRIVSVLWPLCIVHIVFYGFRNGLVLVPLLIAACSMFYRSAFRLPYTPDVRYRAMPAIVKANYTIGLSYILMLLVGHYWR